MINKKRLLENLQSNRDAILEYTMAALANMSDDGRKNRSVGMTAKLNKLGQSPSGAAWLYWTVPSQSDPNKSYNTIVELDVPGQGGFFTVAKEKARIGKKIQTLGKSDVKVYCDCPDFYWAGQKYNLGPSGKYGKENVSAVPGQVANYKYDKGTVTYAPDKRDPNREHVLCKHILAVARVLPANAATIFSRASAFNVLAANEPKLASTMDQGGQPLLNEVDFVEAPKSMVSDTIDAMQNVATKLDRDAKSGASELIRKSNQRETEVTETEPIQQSTPSEPSDLINQAGVDAVIADNNILNSDKTPPPAPEEVVGTVTEPQSPISDEGAKALVDKMSAVNEIANSEEENEITIPS